MAQEGEDVKAAAAAAGKGAAPAAASRRQPPPAAAAAPQAKAPPPAPAPVAAPTAAAAPAAPATNGHAGGRVFSSPLARRLAKEAGIDLGRIQGTGPHGRVIARDVATAKAGGGLRAPAAGEPARRR